MLKNYFKIAWRSLLKNKFYSLLNILGLAIGLSCFILISLYVVDELSYDRYNEKADRIYRINSDLKFGDHVNHSLHTSDMMGPTLIEDYPQVEEYVRIYISNGAKMIRKGSEYLNEAKVGHADSSLFRVFSLPLIAGDANTALKEPNSVVLSEAAANKYFGSTDVMGKTIETIDGQTYEVTAVMKDIPHNSHFDFEFIFSMDNVAYKWGNYVSSNFHTYLLFKEGIDVKAFEEGLRQYIIDYVIPQAKLHMNISSLAEFEAAGNKLEYSLIPLLRIHLYSDRSYALSPGGSIQYVLIFAAVALFILLIACINFMNLATARSASRAKEVGIRKVLGSERRQLVLQFLTEATLMAFLALLIALGIAYLVLPLFNDLSAKSLSLSRVLNPDILLFLLALPFLVGLLAGSYPAFFLSAFKPTQVLKGKISLGAANGLFRNGLVVFQFAASIILIIGTMVVYQQLDYIQSKNLGFDKNQILVVNDTYTLGNKASSFKEEILQLQGVEQGTLSGFLPVSSSYRTREIYSKEAVSDSESGFRMQTWAVDHDYLETFDMELLRGRNFSPQFRGDSTSVIINETTAQLLGYHDPIGKTIYAPADGDEQEAGMRPIRIIGVVKNFHYESLRQEVEPLGMMLSRNIGMASFKVEAGQVPFLLAEINEKWKSMAPGMPFSYRFLDEAFDQMYRTEMRIGKIAMVFSFLAILIACMGLFGLATFIARKRTREIGIRKVLGASVSDLVQLLSKDFLKLILLAIIIASPVAWYFMRSWLQDFAYRIDISWWVFIGAGLGALFIAMATVSVQAVKAAMANPVKNLRTE